MESNNTTNIVKYIIRNTPFGHLRETIDNIKFLVGNLVIDHPEVQNEIKTYEEEHFKQISLNEEKIVITKYNKDQDNYYYDQSKNLKICVNPMNENIEKIEKITSTEVEDEGIGYTDEFSKNLHKSLTKLLSGYKERCYKNGVAAVNCFYTKDSNSKWKIILIVSAHNLNLKNFWTGEWLSLWEIQKEKDNNFSLKGNVKANTYYYEEGNIQFNMNKEISETLNANPNEEGLAKEIIQSIENIENNIQIDLDKVYDNFSDNYIKPLRRKLPVTGTKMNWSLNQIGILK